MSESKQKTKKRINFNEDIVHALVVKYGVTAHFVRMSIRGDRKSLTSDCIVKDYKKMTVAAKQAVEQFKQVNN